MASRPEPHYFGAGPALLPTHVLEQAAAELVNYQGSGLGVGEISHRLAPAAAVINDTKAHFKELLQVPELHEVIFLQGGGTTGFLVLATNLVAAHLKRFGTPGRAAYVVTGLWSLKAYQEAKRLGIDAVIVADLRKCSADGKFGDIPPVEQWAPLTGGAQEWAYLYYCDNETVNGVEFGEFPFDYVPAGVELVADTSLNFLSRPFDVARHGLMLAGAQKNVGLAGLLVYIVAMRLLEHASDDELKAAGVPLTPIAFHFPTVAANNSAYNTIPIFTLRIIDLVLEDLLRRGGLAVQLEINTRKAAKLYAALVAYPHVYLLPAAEAVRSRMNVVFRVLGDGAEERFLGEAAAAGLQGLKGHRSVGGMRASLYNAVLESSVDLLVEFVHRFAKSA